MRPDDIITSFLCGAILGESSVVAGIILAALLLY